MKRRLILLFTSLSLALMLFACGGAPKTATTSTANEVTIYVSQDRVFAEPVLQAFEKQSGIKVNAVYDTEETKSTGLANRLLAEKNNPQADVFWSNDPLRTILLKRNGALAPYASPVADAIPKEFRDEENYWTGFAARSRVIVYNTNLVRPEEAPKSIFDLTDPKWKGQVAMADPRFGSTSFHVAAMYAELGDEKADDFFRKLKANGVKIVPSNSVALDLTARGEVKLGLTDTDDVNVAVNAKKPVAMVFPDKDGIGVPLMPNMVSLTAGAPRAETGKKLIDYLLSAEVERSLALGESAQIPLRESVAPPQNIPPLKSFKPMTLDYAKAAGRAEEATKRLQSLLGL